VRVNSNVRLELEVVRGGGGRFILVVFDKKQEAPTIPDYVWESLFVGF